MLDRFEVGFLLSMVEKRAEKVYKYDIESNLDEDKLCSNPNANGTWSAAS